MNAVKNIPTKCKAFVNNRIEEIKTPKPQANELLVEVVAFGINRADIEQAKGLYPPPPGAPETLGLELSGVVRAKGKKVKGFKTGERVMGLVPGGAYAEFAILPQETAFIIPKKIKTEEAAALPEAIFTTWLNVFRIGRARPKDHILIQGGSGGVGIHAIQICKRLGLKVFATAGTDQKIKICLSHGADQVFNYSDKDFPKSMFDAVGDGVDIVLDIVGIKYLGIHLKVLKYGGRLVLIDSLSGDLGDIDVGPIIVKNIYLTGSLLRPRSLIEKSQIANDLRNKVMPLIRSGKVKPVIGAVFKGLESVKKAHEAYQHRENSGKTIVIVHNIC